MGADGLQDTKIMSAAELPPYFWKAKKVEQMFYLATGQDLPERHRGLDIESSMKDRIQLFGLVFCTVASKYVLPLHIQHLASIFNLKLQALAECKVPEMLGDVRNDVLKWPSINSRKHILMDLGFGVSLVERLRLRMSSLLLMGGFCNSYMIILQDAFCLLGFQDVFLPYLPLDGGPILLTEGLVRRGSHGYQIFIRPLAEEEEVSESQAR